MRKKIIIITGLTGSGKSGLAVDFARRYNGEIISADSVQIYKDLNIGSAKESEKTRQEITHYLIDIKNYDETYNVGEFILDCKNAIDCVLSKGKLPIIVGGTGLYVKALLEGYTLGEIVAHPDFREKYENLAKEKGNEYVWNELNNLSKEYASKVHFNNLKRVIRYLEILTFGGEHNAKVSILDDYDVYAVGLIEDREKIYPKLDLRVDKMLDEGLETEIADLFKKGAKRSWQSMNSIGYKEWFDFYEHKATREETINLIKQHTRNYCKRQLTFLKTIKNLKLLKYNEAKRDIEEFLNDRD